MGINFPIGGTSNKSLNPTIRIGLVCQDIDQKRKFVDNLIHFLDSQGFNLNNLHNIVGNTSSYAIFDYEGYKYSFYYEDYPMHVRNFKPKDLRKCI